MKQVHRSAVAQRMRRDPLRSKARAGTRCSKAVLADQIFERITAEPLTPDRREQRPIVIRMIAHPRLEQLGGIAAKRCASFLPALAQAADMRACAQRHIAATQANQFRGPQARLERKQEQRVIPPSCPCRTVWSREQRRDLLCIKERHRAFHITLVRHRQNALAVEQPGRIGHRDIAEERADRGKPGVAAARAVAPRRLGVDEEVGDQIGIDILNREFDRGFAMPRTREPHEQAERIAVACDRVRAGFHLDAQPVGEEALDQRRQGCSAHWSISPSPEVARAIARSSSSGTASRYQNVLSGSLCPR